MMVERKWPVNLQEKDRWLFEHELQLHIDEPKVLHVHHLLADAGLGFANRRKGQKELAYNNIFFKAGYAVILKHLLSGRLAIINRARAIITDGWSNGYFHWLMDCLPRLVVLENACIHVPLVLPAFLQDQPYVKESLSILGKKDFQFLQKGNWYYAESLHFPVHLAPTGNYNEVIMQQLRTKMTAGNAQKPTRKIYISRNRATRRKIENEADILPVLSKLGFTTIYCDNITFEEQVQIFSTTKYLVSNHGAGLSNMLFMPAGGAVIELRKKGDNHNNCYFSLASALNLDYYYLQCDPVNELEDAHIANIMVDVIEFQEQLNGMLQKHN